MGSPGWSANSWSGSGRARGTTRSNRSSSGADRRRVYRARSAVRAATGALEDPFPAWARVHGRDQEELGREGDGATRPAHPDHALFERLAQGLERGDRELPHLVEEEHPVGGQADLTRAQRPAAPADQGHERGTVVGGPEGRLADQHPVGERAPGGRVHPGHRERLLGRERGQQAGQALGQHGLARSRRAHHQQVVPAGGRHLEGVATEGLAPDVGQIGDVGRRRGGVRGGMAGQSSGRAGSAPARPATTRRAQRRPGPGRPPGRRRAARPARAGAVASARAIMPGTWRNEPLRPSSPQKASAFGAARRELARGHQHPHGDGQVEAGTSFSDA